MIHAISHRKLVSIQFNINGNISKEIFPSQGLRQGDPLSPYLFLLCSEGLSAALCIQQRLGNFKGISIARSTPVISHLLFADDTLLFSKATQLSYNALKAALQLYNQAIGQQSTLGRDLLKDGLIGKLVMETPSVLLRTLGFQISNFLDAEELVQWTSSYLLEYKTSQSKRIDVASTCHSHATAKQNQSSEGSYQLYTDVAINIRNSKIGLGAVVKDWNEKVIAGFSLPILAQATPIMAEAMALESALIWCYNIRIPLANIYTDSKQLASKINSPKKELSALADVIEDIKSFLSYIPNVSVHFLPRDCNTHAHHMAKEALGLDEELVWNDIHPNLSIVT
uniref:Uncharacterized protein n=1 Tax=Cannabis sativa TaxID=3483 RepID=A0A803QHA4_CANSA